MLLVFFSELALANKSFIRLPVAIGSVGRCVIRLSTRLDDYRTPGALSMLVHRPTFDTAPITTHLGYCEKLERHSLQCKHAPRQLNVKNLCLKLIVYKGRHS